MEWLPSLWMPSNQPHIDIVHGIDVFDSRYRHCRILFNAEVIAAQKTAGGRTIGRVFSRPSAFKPWLSTFRVPAAAGGVESRNSARSVAAHSKLADKNSILIPHEGRAIFQEPM